MANNETRAQQAYAAGTTANNVRATADKFAIAFWISLLLIPALGFFISWLSAIAPIVIAALCILKHKRLTNLANAIEEIARSTPATAEEIHEAEKQKYMPIMEAYTELLKTSAPLPGKVADESKLPYKKRNIKEAIIWSMSKTSKENIQKNLKSIYLELARWQHGVGQSDQDIHQYIGEGTLDVELMAKSAPEDSSEKVAWDTLINIETDKLNKELSDAGI